MKDVEFIRPIQHEGCDHRATAQASDEGDRLPMPVRYMVGQPNATRAAAASRTMAVLVEVSDQTPVWLGQTCLVSHPAPPGADHIGSLLLRCAQTFFEADIVPLEEPPNRAAAAGDPALAHHRNDSSNVKSACSAISPSKTAACASSGEMLPPLAWPQCFRFCLSAASI